MEENCELMGEMCVKDGATSVCFQMWMSCALMPEVDLSRYLPSENKARGKPSLA